MISEIHGTLSLRTISAAISKARLEAVARSLTLTDNRNARKAIPGDFYPGGTGRTHLDCQRCQHLETTGNYRAQANRCRGTCRQSPTPASGHRHDTTLRNPYYHPPVHGPHPAPLVHRASNALTDNGIGRLEDPGTMAMITVADSLTSSRLNYWDAHGHLPLAVRSTDLGRTLLLASTN